MLNVPIGLATGSCLQIILLLSLSLMFLCLILDPAFQVQNLFWINLHTRQWEDLTMANDLLCQYL